LASQGIFARRSASKRGSCRRAQRQADVVEAVDQAVLAERLHVERDLGAVRLGDDLARQVDRQR
jgi:hypothetical protein